MNSYKYSETKLEQDKNFFFDDKNEIESKIHLANQKENKFQRKDNSFCLIYLRFDLDGLYYNQYTRVYKKLPEILAEVSGIMEPLKIVFSFLIEYFTKYNLDNFLIYNFLCYFIYEKNKDNKMIWKDKNYKNFKNIFKNITNTEDDRNSNNLIKNFSRLDNQNFKDKLNNSIRISNKSKKNFYLILAIIIINQ